MKRKDFNHRIQIAGLVVKIIFQCFYTLHVTHFSKVDDSCLKIDHCNIYFYEITKILISMIFVKTRNSEQPCVFLYDIRNMGFLI